MVTLFENLSPGVQTQSSLDPILNSCEMLALNKLSGRVNQGNIAVTEKTVEVGPWESGVICKVSKYAVTEVTR
jgi:hypothetical protein